MTYKAPLIVCLAGVLLTLAGAAAQDIDAEPIERWTIATGAASGEGRRAEDDALDNALRKAVEEACGVFLNARTEAEDYSIVYDEIFADAVGYVVEYEVLDTWGERGTTQVKVKALVSTQRFEDDWASIAHTVEQEDNPRIIIAVVENRHLSAWNAQQEIPEGGIVQSELESFFLDKGLTLMDRQTVEDVTMRDVVLAALRGDDAEVASLGARFQSDVVVMGRATAKFGQTIVVGGVELHQFTATLNVRVVQSDSGIVLVSRTFGPVIVNATRLDGGEDDALMKLTEEHAEDVLAEVIEAWRRRAQVQRIIAISISGVDYRDWLTFRDEVSEIEGVQAVRRRELTEGVVHIDIEYEHDIDSLAEQLIELEDLALDITEITTNRIRMAVTESD